MGAGQQRKIPDPGLRKPRGESPPWEAPNAGRGENNARPGRATEPPDFGVRKKQKTALRLSDITEPLWYFAATQLGSGAETRDTFIGFQEYLHQAAYS